MERLLPKNNRHTARSIVFFLAIFCVSAGIAFAAQKHFSFAKSSPIVIAQPVQNENPGQVQPAKAVIDSPLISKEPQIIAPPPVVVPPMPAVRSKDQPTLLEEARLYTQPQITVGKYIDISLKYQNMVIFEDGKALDAYMVSSGLKGLDTPTGTFKIENKSPRAWSKKYGLWMPFWMAFLPDGEMGIHELPVWPSGYREGANHLGIPVSHGCVRLGIGPAKRVYDWTDLGTPVIIHQ